MMSGTPAVLYFPATWNLTHHPPWLRSQRRMVACKEASELCVVIAIHYVQVVVSNVVEPAIFLWFRLRLGSLAVTLDLSQLLELAAVPALPYGGCGLDDFALQLAQIESRSLPRHIPKHRSHNFPQATQARRREGVYDVRSAPLE